MIIKFNREKGIGLLELMLSLAIIAILLLMATRFFLTASQSSRINQAVTAANALAAAGESWSQAYKGSYSGLNLDECVKNGWIPTSLVDSNKLVTPWGSVPPDTSTTGEIKITFTTSSTKEGRDLHAKLCPSQTIPDTKDVTYQVISQVCS